MPASLKALSKYLGIVLTVLCIGFVAWRFSLLTPQIRRLSDWPSVLAGLSIATLIYSLGALFLAIAWWFLLRTFARAPISLLSASHGHLLAQLAKYLPGNLFHFAARHVHAHRNGLDHIELASAAFAESLLLVIMATLLSVSLPTEALPAEIQWLATWRWPIVIGLLCTLSIGVYILRSRAQATDRDPFQTSAIGNVLGAFACYLVFFLMAAAAFRSLLEIEDLSYFLLLSTVAISWLGGFLVFGAPGGLGVREALLVTFLGPVVGEAHAIYAALVFRGATILGDVVVFLVGVLIGRRTL